MKIKWLLICLLPFFFISCSGEEEPEPEPGPVKQGNLAPGIPVQLFPEDKTGCSPDNLELRWMAATDPEGDAIQYLLQISKYPDFAIMAHYKATSALQETVRLERGVLYYWRIQADDHNSKSEFSPVRSFYTEPDVNFNSIPYQPTQVEPGNNAEVEGTVLLQWNAEDPDGDVLYYDLYLGTGNPPQLFKADLTEDHLETELQPGVRYFWKIEAKDNLGAKAVGEIWTFISR